MPGLGLASLGHFALGFGFEEELQAPPQGVIEGAAYMNPRTRDYELADDGAYKRMPITRHRVLMLLMTELDSSVRVDGREPLGLTLPNKIGPSFKQQAEQSVRECLATLANDILIEGVETELLGTGRVLIEVSFTDLTTGNSETVTI